jgi:hypothetical protein
MATIYADVKQFAEWVVVIGVKNGKFINYCFSNNKGKFVLHQLYDNGNY